MIYSDLSVAFRTTLALPETKPLPDRCGAQGAQMVAKDGMLVDIVVKVKVAGREPQSRVAEARLEEEAVSVVAECLSKEQALEFQEASLLGFEHCKWVFEDGMPVPCGLPEPVRLFTDGSWSYPYRGEEQQSGRDFVSLVRFIHQQLGC